MGSHNDRMITLTRLIAKQAAILDDTHALLYGKYHRDKHGFYCMDNIAAAMRAKYAKLKT